MIAVAILGCAKPKSESKNEPKSAKNEPKGAKKAEPVAIAMGPANNTRSKRMTLQKLWFIPLHEEMWFIEWQSANLALINGSQSGFMFKVHGHVYEKGQEAGEFFADRAEADQAVDRLILDGGIKILSDKSTMTAKKVEWLAGNEVFKASGDVLLDGPDGLVGPVDVLFVSPKLMKVASSLKYFQK